MTRTMRVVRGLTDATLTLASGIILAGTLLCAVAWIAIPPIGLLLGWGHFSWSSFAVWLILGWLCWALVVELVTNRR